MKKTSLTKIVLMWALFLMPTLLVHAQDEEVVATAKPTVFVDKISAGSSSDKLTVLNAVCYGAHAVGSCDRDHLG